MSSVVTRRLLALFIDWLWISAYLMLLAIVSFAIYLFVLDGIPEFSSIQTQLIATFATVVPVIIWFTVKEAQVPFASPGKIRTGLTVDYLGNPWSSALIRTSLKFLPWQLAHMSVIDGMYNGWDSHLTTIVNVGSIFLGLTYILQVVVTPSHRHLPDLIARARVVSLPR